MNILKGAGETSSQSCINYPQESKFKIYVICTFIHTRRKISLSLVTERGGK
jgi:hypothetical protein